MFYNKFRKATLMEEEDKLKVDIEKKRKSKKKKRGPYRKSSLGGREVRIK